MEGIDWGTGDSTVAYTARTTWDAPFVYTPYIPVIIDRPTQYYTFTYQPVIPAEYINLNFVVTKDGCKMHVKSTDHFIEHEDLFKI